MTASLVTATWAEVPPASDFTLANLPFGVVRLASGRRRVATRIGDRVLFVGDVPHDVDSHVFEEPTLDAFAALGPDAWSSTREALARHLTDERCARPLPRVEDVDAVLPFAFGDYVDFYSSIEHATNLGRIFRPDSEPLLPNWRHLPVAYHGRSGTIVASGADVVRPAGLVSTANGVERRPSAALDIELEVGFVVGVGSERGATIEPDRADAHVFGAVLVNDWSARDIQAFEYQPLGPMLGKSFATTVSPWVVPLHALRPFLIAPPVQDPQPDPFLRATRPWALDIELAVDLRPNGGAPHTISRTSFRHLYWTFAQQLAHLTSNGASVRTGDLFASGTVSGREPGSFGSLIELTWNGERPLRLPGGVTRSFLEDGDIVTLRGWCGAGERRVGFGEATGRVVGCPPHLLRRPG